MSAEKVSDANDVIPTNDTTPITPAATNDGETTPLRQSKNIVDKLVLSSDIAAGLTQNHQRDSYSKFKNPHEPENATVDNIQVRFSDDRAGSSWSLDTSNASSVATTPRWYQHPKVKEHWKVVVMSFILFFIGLGLCITGIVLEALEVNLSAIYIFFVVGAVCFIPGVYHLIAVYCAVKGKRGFRYEFDDLGPLSFQGIQVYGFRPMFYLKTYTSSYIEYKMTED